MTNEVSRRNFVALAGTVADLGACSSEKTSSSQSSEKSCLDALGGGDGWGEHTDKKGKNHFTQNGNNKVTFTPTHLCLVYLRFEAAMLVVEHAYFPIATGGPDPAAFAKNTFEKFKFAGWPTGAVQPSKDFSDFNFGSQQIVYFYVDNGSDAIFDDKYQITFTQYGVKEGRPKWDNSTNPPTLTKPKQMDKNNAFFDSTIIEPNLIVLNNWFTTKNGKKFEVGDTDENYSMNIHLQIRTTNGSLIPIIIDPDTGNGMGNNP